MRQLPHDQAVDLPEADPLGPHARRAPPHPPLRDRAARGHRRSSAAAGASPLDAISGRNKLAGVVTRIRVSGLLAEVTLDVGGQTLTSIITAAAAQAARAESRLPAVALIKATEVMVIRA